MESSGKTTFNCMRAEWNSLSPEYLGVLRAHGPDAVSFLQGQLSNDVTLLGPERALLAGYHNPQGRVIAVLHLVQLARDDILVLMPRELIGAVLGRLAKFILRAKVKLTDESASWSVSGLIASEAPSGDAPAFAGVLPATAGATARAEGSLAVCVAQQPARWLLIAPASARAAPPADTPAAVQLWRRLAIGAGDPQVYAATTEEFVAQMLNLDVVGAIALDKGCYTGQEVIARAHYRGRVKRRMQRFITHGPLQLKAGGGGVLAHGRALKVVDAVILTDGRCEFLAVTTLPGAATEASGPQAAAAGAPIIAQQLALPYALPP
jgi:tRNA-modifying protein YgfZ